LSLTVCRSQCAIEVKRKDGTGEAPDRRPGVTPGSYAKSLLTTFPETSVRRKSRPWNL